MMSAAAWISFMTAILVVVFDVFDNLFCPFANCFDGISGGVANFFGHIPCGMTDGPTRFFDGATGCKYRDGRSSDDYFRDMIHLIVLS